MKTCRDCSHPCPERSREYPCRSFTSIDDTSKPNKAGASNKLVNYTKKSNKPKTVVEELREYEGCKV